MPKKRSRRAPWSVDMVSFALKGACAGVLPYGVNCLVGCAHAAQARLINEPPGSRPCATPTDFIEEMQRGKGV